MEFHYFSHNGELRPIGEASMPLGNIEYQYGFGVYESIRVVHGVPYYLSDHVERLMESARIISIAHSFTPEIVADAVRELIAKADGTYNIKILLIGPSTSLGASGAQLFILPLNPHFPDKKLYRDGVHTVTYEYERAFPHAKTLNMLQSYLAYKKAKEANAYDALLIDREGNIREGTRTNFFCIKDKTIYSPPEEKILLGVTRKIVLTVAKEQSFEIVEKDIRPEDLSQYEAAFLTSTSSGIMPIASVESFTFGPQSESLKALRSVFETFVDGSGGEF